MTENVLRTGGMPPMDGPQDERPALPAPPPTTVGPASPHRRTVTVRHWRDGWWAVVLHCLHLVTATLGLGVVVLTITGVSLLPALGTGLLVLALSLWGAWLLGRTERHLLLALTGTDIGEPPASAAPTWRRLAGLDVPRLRSLGWAALHTLWGLVAGSLVVGLMSSALTFALLPFYAGAIGEQGLDVHGVLRVHHTVGYVLLWLVGLAGLVLAPWAARGLARVDVALARWLVGMDPDRQLREMSQRMETLSTTRTETVDSVEAERRRIERDLHDGPQQRLVSIAMSLGLARDALDHGRDAGDVRALLDEAHASSKEAITEMRQVARGIVPPILTDRGLDAAVSALAARCPVPVAVTSRVPERLDPTVEAIAYFCISEALTNVAKHAQATRATVDLGLARSLDGDRLAVTVTDDGRGGAVVGGGTGLTGLRQRVAAVDGDVHVHSPVGGGTTVAITLPMRTEVAR